jgi:hypothetical protein
MNHIGQLLLFITAIIGVVILVHSRKTARQIKIDALDAVAKIQVDDQLCQNHKDMLILEWVKTLGRLQEISSLFGDIVIVAIIIVQIVMLGVSFTF